VRPGVDVVALSERDQVVLEDSGLSCAPDDPWLLPPHRRPESLGGTSKHPVWSIQRNALPPHRLASRADSARHESILPLEPTTLGEFEVALRGTASDWRIEHE
jgi:hypothetical protein